jgi:hypothetical protein
MRKLDTIMERALPVHLRIALRVAELFTQVGS